MTGTGCHRAAGVDGMTRETQSKGGGIALMRKRNTRGGKRWWLLSDRLRLIVFAFIIVILFSFLASIYFLGRKDRMDHAAREAENLLNSLSNNILSEIERYKSLSRLIMVDDRLVAFLRAEPEEVNEGVVNNAIMGILEILNVTVNVDSIFVFREDGKYLSTNRGEYMFDYERMETEEWSEDILDGLGRAVISVNGNNAVFKTKGMSVVTIGRAVYDLLTQQRTGIMLMNISDAMLEQTIRATKNENVCIVDEDGKLIAGNAELPKYYSAEFAAEETFRETVEIPGGRRLVSGCRIPNTPLVILCYSDIDAKIAPSEMGYVLFLFLLVFVTAAFVVGAFVTKNITDPVFALTSAMEKNREEGKLERLNMTTPRNEIGMLKDVYNNMIDRVNEQTRRLLEKEKNLQRAEMRVLNEQIKPHFLYNSLETIGYLALEEGAENVYSALETLGSFYRNFLSKGDREIPLEREVNIVQDYLALQKLRYGEIIEDEYDLAEDAKKCIIPKLTLQPLVENSIYHGIRLKGEPGIIRIAAWLEDGMLHVLVRDTGIGMSKEQIDRILSTSREGEENAAEQAESFGLWGTIERIRYFCDRDDVVRIRSEEGEYTEVEFIFPPNRGGQESDKGQEARPKSKTEPERETRSETKTGPGNRIREENGGVT